MGETQSGNMGGDTAAADALAALQTPDPRSLSWFVGGAMAPEDAAAYQQRVMAQFDVPASVPETVTKSFDRLRAIYQQALLCYDLYTVAVRERQRPGHHREFFRARNIPVAACRQRWPGRDRGKPDRDRCPAGDFHFPVFQHCPTLMAV